MPIEPEVRSMIGAHLMRLNAYLAFRDPRRLGTAIGKLLAAWPRRSSDAATTAGIIQTYTAVLGELPLWACEEACGLVLRGQVPDINPAYPPSAAEMYRVAALAMQPVHAERRELLDVVDAAGRALPPIEEGDAKTRAERIDAILAPWREEVAERQEDERESRKASRANAFPRVETLPPSEALTELVHQQNRERAS